jgi:hypothetical protein
MTAQKGRTYDRTAPSGETSEKALVSGAVPHMTIRLLYRLATNRNMMT